MRTLSFSMLLLAAASATAQITPGHLVCTRVGDGVAVLTNASTAVFLDEFTLSGSLVQSIALPTAAVGSQLPVTNSGTATSEGALTQSVDGRYLIAVGYGTPPGATGSVASSSSATVNRVVCRIGLDGSIDSSTALTDACNGNNFRGGVSLDGNQFWVCGASSSGGARYVPGVGQTSSTQVSTTLTNLRRLDVFAGQLYCTSSSGAFLGLSTVGTGLPTASGETITLLNGFPTSTGPSSYDFFFADASTVYVADDRTNGQGGVQKWTESAGLWTLQYTLAPASNVGCRGLSGFVDSGTTVLFATDNAGNLVTTVDMGPTSTFTTLASSAPNTALRGVRFVRSPASTTVSGTGCATTAGLPTIGTSGGAPVTGNLNFAFTSGNAPAFTLVFFMLRGDAASPIGFPIPGAPACALTYLLPDVLLGLQADALGDTT
ncbi:MAG: hypothetical protein K8J09_14410, partial [Planctomycetes bacterium]|nr:hypothetical protein [Planctomycetota bacterium]